MGRAIFISYRRDDTEGEAGRLFDDLTRTFGENSVFMDVAGINPGIDFRKAIDDNVAGCGVLLAMIGPTWATISNSAGARRLEDANDFVRLEIASALSREVAVIPVLVHDAKMPHPDQLPDNLKDLAYRNSVEITHARWNSDVQLLIDALRQYVAASGKKSDEPVHATVSVQLPPANPPGHSDAPAKTSKTPLIAGIAAAAVLVIAAAAFFAFHGSGKQGNSSADSSTSPSSSASAAPAAAQTAPQNPFAGTWTNTTFVKGNGLNKLEIVATGDQLSIHAWANCEPTDCDWGMQSATVTGQQATATWTHLKQSDGQEKGRVATVTIKPQGADLSVAIVNTYTNRPAVEKQFTFVRAQ
jgi:hypothetical protein